MMTELEQVEYLQLKLEVKQHRVWIKRMATILFQVTGGEDMAEAIEILHDLEKTEPEHHG